MSDELKPCPCCNGAAHVTKGHALENVWPHGDFYRVFCGSCQLRQLFYKTEVEAIAAWNHRAPAAPAVQEPVCRVISGEISPGKCLVEVLIDAMPGLNTKLYAAPVPAIPPELPDDTENLLHKLRSLSEAYSEDVFPPLTEDECKKLGPILDRASAGMGRHLAKYFTEAANMIERFAAAPPSPVPQSLADKRCKCTFAV